MPGYFPPAAFYFKVTLVGKGTPEVDVNFKEVSGIRAELEDERIVEGGENRFAHRLPTRAKYSNLVLKRGLVTVGSFFADWVKETIGSDFWKPISPLNLQVSLLKEDGKPTAVWVFTNAYPVRWEVDAMNSMENKILIETLEMSYSYFKRMV